MKVFQIMFSSISDLEVTESVIKNIIDLIITVK